MPLTDSRFVMWSPISPIAMGLAWIWREGGRRILLMARRLWADYTLSRSSISEKRPNSCDTGVRYSDASCGDMVTQFLFLSSCSFRLGVPAIARKLRSRVARVVRRQARVVRTAVVRLGDECTRLSLSLIH